MIKLFRGPAPEGYERRAARAAAALRAFYSDVPELERLQQRPNIDMTLLRELRPALMQLQQGKCCYCESAFSASSFGDIENYRPKILYPWLVYDWDNVMIACPVCNAMKGAKFPLAGEQCPPGTTEPGELALEKPLILNPFTDDPANHLRFEGALASGLTDRGRVTSELLGLNRPALLDARRQAVEDAQLLAEQSRCGIPALETRAREQLARIDTRPYSAAMREALGMVQHNLELDVASPDEEEAALRSATRFIEHIDLRNVKSLETLQLTFTEPEGSDSMPWLVLIGENAVGKSTVLQAVALVLSGSVPESERGTIETLLRRGAGAGAIRVWLSGLERAVEIRMTPRRIRASNRPDGLRVLAYGATRLIPMGDQSSGADRNADGVANLFDPFVPLEDPVRWISALSEVEFAHAARSLKDVLGLPNEKNLRRETGGSRSTSTVSRSFFTS